MQVTGRSLHPVVTTGQRTGAGFVGDGVEAMDVGSPGAAAAPPSPSAAEGYGDDDGGDVFGGGGAFAGGLGAPGSSRQPVVIRGGSNLSDNEAEAEDIDLDKEGLDLMSTSPD